MAHLRISLLGSFWVDLDGKPVTGFVSDKARALLAYLAVESDRLHRRETLAGLLWPERPERAARQSLSQALSNLRRILGDREAPSPFLMVTRHTLQFDAASHHWLDTSLLENLLQEYRDHCAHRSPVCDACLERLQRAVEVYGGRFLEGFSLGDSAAFEEWVLLEQERYHRLVVNALEYLVRSHRERDEPERSVQYARQWVELAPWQEVAHRQLMHALALSGRRSAALEQYETCRHILARELGVEPEAETVALCHSIRDGQVGRQEKREPCPHNLPASLGPLIGRERELAHVADQLCDAACRLLTVLGLGGSGKTRLALGVATNLVAEAATSRAVRERFRHGIYFCPLTSVRSVEAIAPAIAQALGFAFYQGGTPRQQLIDYLRSKQMLLVLDNFEQLLACGGPGEGNGADLVVDILRAAPGVKILLTSRVRLSVQDEHLFPLAGVAFGQQAPESVERLASYPAPQLFLHGARQVRPGFAPTDEDLRQIARICGLVQGMPLAILLAAAWMTALTPAEIATEISAQLPGHGLDFLEADWRDVPSRQRSMRALFDHSWRLLDEREQHVFVRVSVFRGGFTREAAYEVAGASLGELIALVNKSFLTCTLTGRYEVHELLRQYAEERLDREPGERAQTLDRHCTYYARFVLSREDDLIGGKHEEALPEMDNIRAAWRWAAQYGKVAEIIDFYAILMLYTGRGWRQEGLETYQQAVDALRSREPVGETGIALGLAVYGLGYFHFQPANQARQWQLFRESHSILSRFNVPKLQASVDNFIAFDVPEPEGWQLLQKSLQTFRRIGLQTGVAWTLVMMGGMARRHGACHQAQDYYLQAIEIYERCGYRALIAFTLGEVGKTALLQQDRDQARRAYEESLAIAREIGYQEVMGNRLEDLGDMACAVQEYEKAGDYYRQALAVYGDWGIAWRMVSSYERLARAALAAKAYPEASKYFRRALQLAQERQDAGLALPVLPGIAELLLHIGHDDRPCTERAVELAALAAFHSSTTEETRSRADGLLEGLPPQLSPSDFAAAQERGRNLDLEDTVAELMVVLRQ